MTENEVKDYLEDLITEGQYLGDKNIARDDEEALQTAIATLEEIQLYHSIGTVEECKEAMERQKIRKPRKYLAVDGVKRCGCPNCYEKNGREEILYAGQSYCSICGQELDWGKSVDLQVSKSF